MHLTGQFALGQERDARICSGWREAGTQLRVHRSERTRGTASNRAGALQPPKTFPRRSPHRGGAGIRPRDLSLRRFHRETRLWETKRPHPVGTCSHPIPKPLSRPLLRAFSAIAAASIGHTLAQIRSPETTGEPNQKIETNVRPQVVPRLWHSSGAGAPGTVSARRRCRLDFVDNERDAREP